MIKVLTNIIKIYYNSTAQVGPFINFCFKSLQRDDYPRKEESTKETTFSDIEKFAQTNVWINIEILEYPCLRQGD